MRSSGRLIAGAAVGVVGVVGVAVWLFLVVVGTTESGHFSNGGVGVSRSGDAIVIESCVGPIGKVDVSKGTDAGKIVWAATSTGAGVSEVPVVGSVAGYTVVGGSIDPGSTAQFAIQTVNDLHGSPFMSTILPFVPAHLKSGRVTLASGDDIDLVAWRASSSCK